MNDSKYREDQNSAAILEYTHGDAPPESKEQFEQSALETKQARVPIVPFPIFIDNNPYLITQYWISGSDIRHIAQPNIEQDRDVYLEIYGNGGPGDYMLSDIEAIELDPRKEPRRFFSIARPQPVRSDSNSEYFPTHGEIAERAYQIYAANGFEKGRDVENWLTAESQLIAEYGALRV